MSYYRAALAASSANNLSYAIRLVKCSLAFGEKAAGAAHLLELLQQQNHIEAASLNRLRILIHEHRYKKALKIKWPRSSKTHTIRGLLYASLGRYRKARKEFTLSLMLDSGNELAKQALFSCEGKRG